MKTREQVTVTGDFPAAPWLTDDIPARNAAWGKLRQVCAKSAADRGLALAENEPAAGRSVLYRKLALVNGESLSVECSRGEAEFVRLRLSAWAEPAGGASA